MTKYINTTAIKFKQFDGSEKMMADYDIEYDIRTNGFGPNMPVDESVFFEVYFIKTPSGEAYLDEGDWIGTDANGKHFIVTEAKFQQHYQPIAQIPSAIYHQIKMDKAPGMSLLQSIHNLSVKNDIDIKRWLFGDDLSKPDYDLYHQRQAELAQAWLLITW